MTSQNANRRLALRRGRIEEQRRAARAASGWRDFFGMHPELDEAQPGHRRGCLLSWGTITICGAAYVVAAWRGI